MRSNKILFILLLIFIFSHIDRQLVAILLPVIKTDFCLSDTQLGFLTGTAFAIFYTAFGIPAGWLADRFSRHRIILIAFTLWSLFTALFGMSQSYLQLLVSRSCVAIGEAGSNPASHSIIADLFPPNRRSPAMAIYASGINIGILCAFLLGGILGHYLGWRTTFIAVGLLGIVTTLVISGILKEPLRQLRGKNLYLLQQSNTIKLLYLWQEKTLRYLIIGCALANFVALSISAWIPSFLVRQHHLSLLQAGVYLSLSIGLIGASGTYLGGTWTERLAQRGQHWLMRLPSYFLIISVPFYWLVLLSNNTWVILIAFQVPVFLALSYMGPSFSTVQNFSTPFNRAFNASVLIFAINVIGLGLGPLLSGFLSDFLTKQNDVSSLRHSLAIITSVNLLAAFFYWLAAKHIAVKEVAPDKLTNTTGYQQG